MYINVKIKYIKSLIYFIYIYMYIGIYINEDIIVLNI